MKYNIIVAFVTVAVGAFALGWQVQHEEGIFGQTPSPSPSQRACTEEARLCPDGSYVGRMGPNCEFAPCPTSQLTPMPPTEEPIACTMDARQCPDGTFVGRIGPDCEFAPCPGN
jgi:hypothetical protein